MNTSWRCNGGKECALHCCCPMVKTGVKLHAKRDRVESGGSSGALQLYLAPSPGRLRFAMDCWNRGQHAMIRCSKRHGSPCGFTSESAAGKPAMQPM